MTQSPKLQAVIAARLREAGFVGASPIQHFANRTENDEALFRVGNLLLHFEDERTVILTSVASTSNPELFYEVFIIKVAMGAHPVEYVRPPGEFVEVDQTLAFLHTNFDMLNAAFDDRNEPTTRVQLLETKKKREQWLLAYLRRGKQRRGKQH